MIKLIRGKGRVLALILSVLALAAIVACATGCGSSWSYDMGHIRIAVKFAKSQSKTNKA